MNVDKTIFGFWRSEGRVWGVLGGVLGGGGGVYTCSMTKTGGFHQKNCQINASKLAVFFMKNGRFERKKPGFFRQKCQFSFAGFTAFPLTI
ncbi:MAG: hypothetical protein IKH22_07195 [Prevotella sp.]|nr:hypothetical protein [Prevotella sp.]